MTKTPNVTDDFLTQFALYSQSIGVCALSIADSSLALKNKTSFLEGIQNFPEDLDYLHKNQEVRDNLDLILPNAQSVITCAFSYAQEPIKVASTQAQISMYALGRDYHKALKSKLKLLGEFLKKANPSLNYRAITDSAPFYEKYYALFNNASCIGKNNLVRIKNCGSMIFFAELLVDITLPQVTLLPKESKTRPLCPSNCQKCLKACPTGALSENGFAPKKCLSYLTIENKGPIPDEIIPLLGNKIYGCDLCQTSCPYNQAKNIASFPNILTDFFNRYDPKNLAFNKLITMTEAEFKTTFAGSAILRIGYNAFMRNILCCLLNQPKGSIDLQLLNHLANRSPLLDNLLERVKKYHQSS